jgi:hypothetical protein
MATLNFRIQKQSALNLCWAAVTSSISKFYDNSSVYDQCILANNAFKRTDCCTDLSKCDMGWYIQLALTMTNNLRSTQAGVPDIDVIRQEIGNNRIIALTISWSGGGFHDIAIYGVHDDDTVDVADPWPSKDPGTVSLTELALFYKDMGQITSYYLTDPSNKLLKKSGK